VYFFKHDVGNHIFSLGSDAHPPELESVAVTSLGIPPELYGQKEQESKLENNIVFKQKSEVRVHWCPRSRLKR
jgi:hypothetical protein